MYEIFEKLLLNKGIKPRFIALETGVAPASLSAWKNGQYHPKDDKMQLLADYLGVSLNYLKGIEKDVICPDCHLRYEPIDMESSAYHEQYHNRFLKVQSEYGFEIPDPEEVDRLRSRELLIFRDIGYDKYRRVSAFNTYAKYEFAHMFYERGMIDESLDAFTRNLADGLRPDASVSLSLCNEVRKAHGLGELTDVFHGLTEDELDLVKRYRAAKDGIKEAVDILLGDNDDS